MSTPILTQSRHALWEAIESRPSLKHYFRQKFVQEEPIGWLPGDTDTQDDAASPMRLPAIGIFYAPSSDTWVLNQGRENSLNLAITVWFPGRSLLEPERIWQEIANAILDDSIQAKTGMYAQVGAFQIVPTMLRGIRITRLTQQVLMPYRWFPEV